MKGIRLLFLICFIGALASCNSVKYVGDGEYLLDEVEIISDDKVYKSGELKSYLRQQPNFKAFGLMKWQLYVYSWSGKNEKKLFIIVHDFVINPTAKVQQKMHMRKVFEIFSCIF